LSLDDVAAKLPDGEFTVRALSDAIGRSPSVTKGYLLKLVEAGTVGLLGSDKTHTGKGKAPLLYSKA
jgi:hypothetical protein